MVRRSERSNERRIGAAAIMLVALSLGGCVEESPAYVIDPDRSAAYVEPQRTFTVTVREGDSLALIAEHCGTDTDTLLQLNNIYDARMIYPGQVLRIPDHPCKDYVADVPRPEPRPQHHAVMARYEPEHPRMADRDRPATPPSVPPDRTAPSWWSSWWNDGATASEGEPQKFMWPVHGQIIEGFGPGNHGERNDGINIAAAEGTPIHAAASGVVTYAGNELRGYGNLVLIKHDDGFVTAYAHAGSIRVARGDRVEKGEVIGTAGQTGDVDRPQLHFEIRRGVEPVDPERYLSGRAS